MHKSLTRLLFMQVTYNWHLSFIDNHWTSDNAFNFLTPTLIKMAHSYAKIKQTGIDFKTATWHCYSVKLSNIGFKLGEQNTNIYLLTSGSVNSNKKIHKMASNGWHMSISRILNGFPWLENTILYFWRYRFRASENITFNCKKGTFHVIAWNRRKGASFTL